MTGRLRYAANCSLLFTEVPLLHRPEAAREAGFDAIELWWPFDEPVPSDRQVDALVGAVREAGVRLVGLNFYAGDLAGPDAGAASVPALVDDFRANVPVVAAIAAELAVRGCNALYGNRVDGVDEAVQDDLALDSLLLACESLAAAGSTVLVEPVSGPKPYPLRTADDAMGVVHVLRDSGAENVALLFDMFHLAGNGEDLSAALGRHTADIGHVQVADAPGRGEPGTGTLDIPGRLADLERLGYDGWVALEYVPTTDTRSSLSWLPASFRRPTEKHA